MQTTDQGKSVMVQGRIVWTVGDLFKGDVAMTYGTKNPRLNKQGQQYREYGFGLAVPKEAFSQVGPGQPGEIWSVIHEVAYGLFPSRQIPPNFHMKWKDGDTGVNQDGTPLNVKKGYPGHIVFALKTSAAPPKFFRWENGQNIQISEGIKCGDYVQVQVNVKAHAGTNAGLYLNPMAVRFLGYGEEIVNAPSGDQLFGTAAPAMPAGASATPVGPVGMIMPSAPAAAPGFAPPMPAAQPAAPATPHFGVLPQAHQPAGYAPPPMPAAPQYAQPPMPGPAAVPQYAQPPQQPQQMPGMPPLPGFQQ